MQITDARSDQQLKSAHFATSNEIKKLQAIVCQLDDVTNRLPADELLIVAPDIQHIRQQVSGIIDQLSELTLPVRDWHCADPDYQLRDEESFRSDLPVGDEVERNWDLEVGVMEKRLVQQSCQRLESDLNDLNDTVNQFSGFVWVFFSYYLCASDSLIRSFKSQAQKETTERIDSNVSVARDRLQSGAVILSKVSPFENEILACVLTYIATGPADFAKRCTTAYWSRDRNSGVRADRHASGIQSGCCGLFGDCDSRLFGREGRGAENGASCNHADDGEYGRENDC